MIKPGEQAPDFELPDQDGNPVRLSDLRGHRVVLYFYPKADTPGCTQQACGVRDHQTDYAQAGATVLGISPDPVKAVHKFHKRKSLNFTLLADEDHKAAEDYGVWVEKAMYGKTFMGAQRSTFVIDEDGVVRHVIKKAKPETHDDEVLAAAARRGGRGGIGGAGSRGVTGPPRAPGRPRPGAGRRPGAGAGRRRRLGRPVLPAPRSGPAPGSRWDEPHPRLLEGV